MPEDKNNVNCVVYEHNTTDWKSISDYEWWTLKQFDGKLIYGYSYGQTESSFFQIIENSNDSLKGKYLSPFARNWRKQTFAKQKLLSKEDFNKIKEMIVGEWEVIKVIEPKIFNLDSIEVNADFSGSGLLRYSGRISKTDLKEHKLKFTLKENGEFLISVNEREIRKGDLWRLTNDGAYIRLGVGIGGNDFVKILSIFDDSMHIQKKEIINSESKRELDFFEVFLNVKLIKKEN
jgi:hypothetical protein